MTTATTEINSWLCQEVMACGAGEGGMSARERWALGDGGGVAVVREGARCPAAGVGPPWMPPGHQGQSPLPRGACRYSKDDFLPAMNAQKPPLRLLFYKVWTTMIIAKLQYIPTKEFNLLRQGKETYYQCKYSTSLKKVSWNLLGSTNSSFIH